MMLSWRFRKVFHALFMWMILPSMYLVSDFQLWSVGFRGQLIELLNGLIPMASRFQLLKQKQFYFIINERWLVYHLLICMMNLSHQQIMFDSVALCLIDALHGL